MKTIVGHFGPDVRGDARITVTSGSGKITLDSSVEELYGDQILATAQEILNRFEQPQVDLQIEDSGALPFVLEARLESALSQHLNLPAPDLPSLDRPKTPRSPRRTRLYVPGSVPKMMPNAGLYRPDVLILDLEDSVLPEEKPAARVLVQKALATLDWPGCERAVRINSGEQGIEDLKAIARLGVDLVLVPKCEWPDAILVMGDILQELGSHAELLPIIESAIGIEAAYDICSATERVTAIAIGLEDYLTDIRAKRTPEGHESYYAMGRIVNAARASAVTPLASVYSKVDDEEGLSHYSKRMMDLGFEGVGCIHPRQVPVVHAAFQPSLEEADQATAIIEQFEAAQTRGDGAISVNGQMVDAPVYERAKNILSRVGGKR